MFKRRFHAILDSSLDAGGGAPPAAAPAPAAATTGAAGLLGAAPAAAPAPAGQSAPPPAAPAPAPASATPWDAIPEKYRVKAADGQPDLGASALKLAEAYGHAERRIGTGDVPPKSADEYKTTVPEALAGKVDSAQLEASDDFKAFKTSMHAAGLTQKQLDAVTGELLARSIKLQEAAQGPTLEQASAELRKTWRSDAEFSQATTRMDQAWSAFAGEGDQEQLEAALKIPAVARLLAKVGAEMEEDQPIQAGTPAAKSWEEQSAAIRANPAYLDASHPQHKQLTEQLSALYAARYGTKAHKLGGGSSSR